MATENKKISIVIPNFNGSKFLPVCLASIAGQSWTEFEVIVVDNGSTDNSREICRHFSKTKFIELEKNFGFSVAVNIGIKDSTGEIIFLLNNDTELDVDCLRSIIEFFESHSQADIMAAKMIFFNNRELINDVGDIFSIYGIAHQRGKGEKNCGQYDKSKRVFGACAGAAAYKKEVFAGVGYLDEDFFAYLEDIDWSFRANLSGKQCWYNPEAIVYHVDGGTSSGIKDFSFFLNYRNAIFVIVKNMPLALIARALPALIIGQMRTILSGVKHRKISLIFKVYWQVLANWPSLLKKRKDIQKKRVIKNKEIWSLLSKKYPFNIKRSFLGNYPKIN